MTALNKLLFVVITFCTGNIFCMKKEFIDLPAAEIDWLTELILETDIFFAREKPRRFKSKGILSFKMHNCIAIPLVNFNQDFARDSSLKSFFTYPVVFNATQRTLREEFVIQNPEISTVVAIKGHFKKSLLRRVFVLYVGYNVQEAKLLGNNDQAFLGTILAMQVISNGSIDDKSVKIYYSEHVQERI